jgi:PBSX family phage terminase large subunit
VFCLLLDMATALNLQLFDQQDDFVHADENFLLFRGGIGSGKSRAGAVRAGLASFGQIGSNIIEVPNVGMVTAPTYNMLRDATFRTFLDLWGDFIASYTKAPPINVKMKNGSEILFRSADNPDLLRGPNLDWWWGDEAAYYHKNVWRVMIGRLRGHGRLGFAWLTTTPKGRNWLYQVFVQAKDKLHRMVKVSTGENPFVDVAFFQMLAESYSGEFARQELGGEFVAFEGLIYPDFDRDVHVTTLPITKLPKFKYTAAGVDWGFAHPGVIGVAGIDHDGRIWMIHEEYARRRNIEDWVDVAVQLQDIWKIDTFFCDPSEPEYIEKFTERSMNAVQADNSVMPGIQAVSNRLLRRGSKYPMMMLRSGCAHTATEFEQYSWAEDANGVKERPVKSDDHCMDMIRYLTKGVGGFVSLPNTSENIFYS